MIGDDRMDVGYELLDLQILDRDGMEVGKVDDVEFHLDEDGVPYLTALLVGPDVFGHRIGGWLGRVITATTRRLRTNRHGPPRMARDGADARARWELGGLRRRIDRRADRRGAHCHVLRRAGARVRAKRRRRHE